MCISVQEVYDNYEHWVDNASVNYFRNEIDGEMIRGLAPKRGNRAYARKQKKKMAQIISGLDKLSFEYKLPGRDGLHYNMTMFLITLTYDHKKITAYDAWACVSNDIAKMKIMIKRALGATSIRTIASKEGTRSDYPAPHLLVVVDKPVHCVRYKSRRGYKFIVHSKKQHKKIKDSWKHGFMDIQGVKSNKIGKQSAVGYLTKYFVKAVNIEEHDVAFRTMAWQKYFNLRGVHISRSFKDILNPVRLDTIMHESQQPIWVFDHAEHISLKDFDAFMLQPINDDDNLGFVNDKERILIGIMERLKEKRRKRLACG